MRKLETLYWEKDGPIARLTLNRPERLNAIGHQGTYDLNEAADQIAADGDVRLVTISGAGRAFSTGIDLKDLSTGQIDVTYHDHWEGALRKLETMEPIVLALVHGYCLGGGLQLAMACDIRVATPTVKMGLPAIKESLIPGLGTWRLPRFIGMGRARWMILSGENIDGEEAKRIGLADHLVGEERYREEFEALVQQYLRVCSQGSRLSKLATNEAFDLDYEAFYRDYIRLQSIAMTSADFHEAATAYREKRDPQWK